MSSSFSQSSVITSVTYTNISDLAAGLASLSTDEGNAGVEIPKHQADYMELLPGEQLLDGRNSGFLAIAINTALKLDPEVFSSLIRKHLCILRPFLS